MMEEINGASYWPGIKFNKFIMNYEFLGYKCRRMFA